MTILNQAPPASQTTDTLTAVHEAVEGLSDAVDKLDAALAETHAEVTR